MLGNKSQKRFEVSVMLLSPVIHMHEFTNVNVFLWSSDFYFHLNSWINVQKFLNKA